MMLLLNGPPCHARGTQEITLSQPVPAYVDNFLGFPVGTIVPLGGYDFTRARWQASENGRVIKILRIENGLAILDVKGQEQAATAAELAALSITPAEQQQLASLYSVEKTLWRARIPHFSPWDWNWVFIGPDDTETPQPA